MDNNIDKWGSLSMPERASLISLFTGSGVTSLNEMRALYNEYGNGGGIHIDPSKRGTFTSAAKRHGMSVQEFALHVLSNKDDYSTAMVRKANFARNAAKWHGDGGDLDDNDPKDPYNSRDGWFRYWYENRPYQIIEAINWQLDGTKSIEKAKKVIYDAINSYNETYIPTTINGKAYSGKMPSGVTNYWDRDNGLSRYVIGTSHYGYSDNPERDFVNNSYGLNDPEFRQIIYTQDPYNGILKRTLIHERSHAIPWFIKDRVRDKRLLNDGVDYDKYLDNINEIYSRLNEFRFKNNLDPRKTYTEDDIIKWRESGALKNFDLDRYDNDSVYNLINNVTSNNVADNLPKNANYANDGGEVEQMFDSIIPSEKVAINLLGLSRKQIKNKAYDLADRYGLNDDIIGTRRQARIFNRTQKRWRDKGADKYIDKQLLDAIRNGDKRAFNDYITLGRDRFATKYAFPVIAGGIAGPAGMLAGMANTIFDAGINQTTGGLRDSWGDLFVDRYSHPVLSSLLEFTNPLNFSGAKASGRLRGEHFYDVLDDIEKAFGKNSKEYRAAIQTKPELVFRLRDESGSIQAYNDKTNSIRYAPWTSKTSLAHEFGHSVGDKLERKGIGLLYDNGKYVYEGHNINTTDKNYIDVVPRELYADAFRQIVKPYRGLDKDLRFRAHMADEYLNDGMPDFTGWSKTGEEVPAFLRNEYSDIYRKQRLDHRNVYEDAAKLGVDPRAYLQMKSRSYSDYLSHFGGTPNIQYHGAPYADATMFPQKSHPLYRGQVRGTGTGPEGIYLTNQRGYAERYEHPGIGVHMGYKPDWYNGGRTYIVSAGVNPIDITDPRMGKMPAWILQHITPENRAYVESLGYNGISGTTGFGFNETAVFSPNQIKSLEGNIGYFNPRRESIYE
jgi:hypothetical protein